MKDSVQEVFTGAGIKPNGDSPWDIQVHDERLWKRLALYGSMGFGEAYMDGWWDCEALDELVNRLLRHDGTLSHSMERLRLKRFLQGTFLNLQKVSRAFQVGVHHYDISNLLYERMLDGEMVYSCGYWQNGATDLDQAQQDKLELICHKIDLQRGMQILDIGCGWGSFCKYAAQKYDAKVVGLTVSREQAALARKRCSGLPVKILLEDYRSYEGTFDRVVSVGMVEHVGPKNYPVFMEMARRCLKPDGLFLLHTIGSNVSYRTSLSWITRHIFPNGHIPSIPQISRSVEQRFVVEDLHNFGPDYDRTLMAWERNFRNAWPEIRDSSPKFDERFYRMWRYYLLACAGAFRARYTQLWQWLLSPEGLAGGYHGRKDLAVVS